MCSVGGRLRRQNFRAAIPDKTKPVPAIERLVQVHGLLEVWYNESIALLAWKCVFLVGGGDAVIKKC